MAALLNAFGHTVAVRRSQHAGPGCSANPAAQDEHDAVPPQPSWQSQ